MLFLVLSCWSHSAGYTLYDWRRKEVSARGTVEGISLAESRIVHEVPGHPLVRSQAECPDHRAAVALILNTLQASSGAGPLQGLGEIAAVGHRVVHGGEKFSSTVLIDAAVLEEVQAVSALAPLHNGPNLAGIEASMALLSTIPHLAIFDTAFHQAMPRHSYLYPVPYEWYEKHGVRRYGFHGVSHLFAARRGAVLLGKAAEECNLITIHLGSGVSLCAVRRGVSYDTSMGLTPLEGAVMGTRCGDIDPGIPAFIMQQEHLSHRELGMILNRKSGLAGLTGGLADRESVRAGAAAGEPRCQLARQMEAYRLKKYIGSFIAGMARGDAIVFTAEGGEHDWELRSMALEGLDLLGIRLDPEKNRRADAGDREQVISAGDSRIRVMVVPACDELVVAEEMARLLGMAHTRCYSFEKPDFSYRGR